MDRGVSFFFYLLFAVWTVGFGYGFFWKELAGQEFTERQFERVITDLSGSVARTSGALVTAERSTARQASSPHRARRPRRARAAPAPTVQRLRRARGR